MRWNLIFIYLAGVLLWAYGAFWESGKPARTGELVLGLAALIAVTSIIEAARIRQARSQPYTTTD